MDSSKLKAIIVAVLAIFAALYLGITAATAQLETIAWMLGGVTLVVCLLLGRNVWLLIPLLGAVDLTLRVPGQPNSLLLAQILVIGFSVLLFTIRRLPFRLRFTEIEFWLIAIGLMAVQAYARNPTGLSIFGGNTVGGKYYFTFALAWMASMLLTGLIVEPKTIWTALKLNIIGGFVNFLIHIAALFIPSVGFWTGVTYASPNETSQAGGNLPDPGQAGRVSGFSQFANNLALWIGSFRNPLLSLIHPLWGGMILLSGAVAVVSGFRTAVITTGLIYLICLYYRGRMVQVIISGIIGTTAIVLLALANSISPLPPNIQRALTFLPGTWEQRYKDDAQGSTEWRVEMWQEALTSDRWIQNKLLGDGMGFTVRELNYQLSLKEGGGANRIGISGFDAAREGVLASGGYHSVFVSSVRTCGYVGAVVFIIAILRTSVRAHRLIIRCRNTEWFPVALFFGIPIIVGAIWFPFNSMTYLQSISVFIYQAAMLRILENNIPFNSHPSTL